MVKKYALWVSATAVLIVGAWYLTNELEDRRVMKQATRESHEEKTIAPIAFYFMRHGQTDANKHRLYVGSTDVPLNEEGFMQARQAAKAIAHLPIQTIVSSPLLRARQTAQAVADRLGKEVTIIDELREMHAGEFEGKPYLTLSRKLWMLFQLKLLRRSMDDVAKIVFVGMKKDFLAGNIAGAEDWPSFVERFLVGVDKALALPGPVLIVAHGGTYHVLQEALGLEAQLIPNCCPVYHVPPADNESCWAVRVVDDAVKISI